MCFLNLCSGTGSVSRAFKDANYDVVDVYWDNRFGPTHCVDIMTWECLCAAGFVDVVWASPDCTQFSRARATARTPRNLERAYGLAKRCLELICQLQPRVFVMGNPDSGLLNTRPFMSGLPYVRCVIAYTAQSTGKGHASGQTQRGCRTCATAVIWWTAIIPAQLNEAVGVLVFG